MSSNFAIFGGAFNPVHQGHLQIATIATLQAKLDRVFWVPTYWPPHTKQDLAEFHHRLAMVQLATQQMPLFSVSDVEAQQSQPSYAIATLQALQHLYPNRNWFWILGLDTFASLPKWHRLAELAACCTWLIAPRGPDSAHQQCSQIAQHLSQRGMPIRWQLLTMPPIEVSSSQIRHYCQTHHSIAGMVPNEIELYIQQQKLYQVS